MKKILAILIALMICVMPLVAFAEDAEVVEGDNSTTTEEVPTEGENSAPTETPEEEVTTLTDTIVKWIEEHSAEIGIIVTLIGYGIVMIKKLGTVIKSAGTMNNNAISMAKTSTEFMGNALTEMQSASGAVTGYQTEIALLLETFRNTAEDKARLENELLEIHKALKLAKESNIEFSNELAELIALANIPNYKKEEMGARHLAAVNAITEAETVTEEVKKDDGKEQ